MSRGGAYSSPGYDTNTDKILVGKPDGKKPVERLRRRCEMDNIEMYLRDAEYEGMGWIDLAPDRVQ
jgi:hypothetical protein